MLRTKDGERARSGPHGRWRLLVALGAVLASVLLLGTGTAQAAGSSPSGSGHARTSRVYLQVTPETAKSIPGGTKLVTRQSIAGANDAHTDATLPTPVQSITPDECLGQASSKSGNGYSKGRFASCQAYHLHTWHVECDWFFGCDIVGTADADLVDIQYTDNGDRDMIVAQFIGNWHPVGDMSTVDLTIDTTCRATGGSGPCDTLSGSPTTMPVDEWVLGDDFLYYSFEQPASSGVAPDQVSRTALSWHLTVTGGENGPVTRNGPNSAVRCDSASYIIRAGGGSGCVFPWAATPTWAVHRSTTPESAQNIYEAQTAPLSTQPPSSIGGVPFKYLVGAPGTSPLHRDRANIAAHRATARAACRTYFPGKYPAPHTDCDEYPFASTEEGAVNYGDFRNYVVKPIDSDDNQQAGRELGTFYAEQRILGSGGINDPFYVSVQP